MQIAAFPTQISEGLSPCIRTTVNHNKHGHWGGTKELGMPMAPGDTQSQGIPVCNTHSSCYSPAFWNATDVPTITSHPFWLTFRSKVCGILENLASPSPALQDKDGSRRRGAVPSLNSPPEGTAQEKEWHRDVHTELLLFLRMASRGLAAEQKWQDTGSIAKVHHFHLSIETSIIRS